MSILKDVYIKLFPNISISDVGISYSYNPGRNNAEFIIISKIGNREFRNSADTINADNNFTYKVRISAPGNSQTLNLSEYNFTVNKNAEREIKQTASVISVLQSQIAIQPALSAALPA